MNHWVNLAFLWALQAIASPNPYALRVGEKAAKRLHLQHSILKRDFENHLLEAGLKRDMTVLEIGGGTGLMACWVANFVGENGRVVVVDKSQEQLEIAQEQARIHGIQNIEFICCDIHDFDWEPNSIDFIYCRFLLMHLTDPLSIVKKMSSFLKKGGVFAAQEPINSYMYLYPENTPFIETVKSHLQNTSLRHGVDYDLGKKLHTLFFQAGYHPIQLHFSQRAIPILQMKDLLLQFFDDIGPAALRSEAISKEDLIAQVLSIQNYPEKEDSYFVMPQQAHVTAHK